MRQMLLLLWCSALTAADTEQLRQLSDANRFFEIRRALEQPGSNGGDTLLYRGLVASRFGHENDGIEMLRSFLAAQPSTERARKAYQEIARAFERLGRYRDAAQAWTEALKLTPESDPDREGNGNTRDLLEALSDVAPQSVEFGEDAPVQATHNRLGSWDVPVQVNGTTGQWIFDTGANMSTLTESEAKRMGLSIRESKAYVSGSTAKKNSLQLAVASEVRLGAARVHNVIFLVLADRALYIGPLHYRINGILGLPVLRALGRAGISNTGAVQIHTPRRSGTEAPNLFFDELTPILEVDREQHRLQMFLDTGANATALYPSFRDALGSGGLRLRTKREKMAGAGGIIKQKTQLVPTLRIEIFAKPVEIKNVSLLPQQPRGDIGHRDGVIGMDALWGGFLLDFDAMRLEVQ
jgi:predicted aspartyl protease